MFWKGILFLHDRHVKEQCEHWKNILCPHVQLYSWETLGELRLHSTQRDDRKVTKQGHSASSCCVRLLYEVQATAVHVQCYKPPFDFWCQSFLISKPCKFGIKCFHCSIKFAGNHCSQKSLVIQIKSVAARNDSVWICSSELTGKVWDNSFLVCLLLWTWIKMWSHKVKTGVIVTPSSVWSNGGGTH